MTPEFDLLIIGGGINGCGIARDAAGRGLRVCLAEMDDLASATSSSSTKLFHGGLRYLEYFELRLVRESLIERENLLTAMPHISWPMRFVLPYRSDMHFDVSTPASRLLRVMIPWAKGRRPAWLIRLGLLIYDHLGGRKILPPSSRLRLIGTPEGQGLHPKFKKAYEYSDCWVDDARLVALNARDAAQRGADIRTRCKVVGAQVIDGIWHVDTENMLTGAITKVTASMLVNAAGPWVGDVLQDLDRPDAGAGVRLVRGSHIVTRRLFDHNKCYFFQGTDGRIIFAIPYETDYTLIGTTDHDHDDVSITPECSQQERDYLIAFMNEYLAQPVTKDDVVWAYSGLRPLYDDGAGSASAATRDYVLKLDQTAGAALLNIFGGKITTYRRLAENALEEIGRVLPVSGGPWTARAALPGGDFPVDGVDGLVAMAQRDYPFLTDRWALRLVRAYGTEVGDLLGSARCLGDLGEDFGCDLFEAEVKWLINKEYARDADDVLWRRSKLGLRMSKAQVHRLREWMAMRCGGHGANAAYDI